MIRRALPLLIAPALLYCATWGSWNGVTVGTSASNISAWNGGTIGTSATNIGAWNGLVSPSGGSGVISRNGASDLGYANASSYSNSYTVTSGSTLLLIAVGTNGSGDRLTGGGGVTWNSGAATRVAAVANGTSDWLYIYCVANPTSGTHTIAVTATSSGLIDMGAVDYAGAAATCTVDSSNTGTNDGSTGILNVSTTTASTDAWAILYTHQYYSGDGTPAVGDLIADANGTSVTNNGGTDRGPSFQAGWSGATFSMTGSSCTGGSPCTITGTPTLTSLTSGSSVSGSPITDQFILNSSSSYTYETRIAYSGAGAWALFDSNGPVQPSGSYRMQVEGPSGAASLINMTGIALSIAHN